MNNKLTQSDWDRLILIVKEEYPIVSSSFSEETEDEWAYGEIICHHDKWDIRIRLEDDDINVSVDDTRDVDDRDFGSYYGAVGSMDPELFMLVAGELLSQLNNRY